MGHKSFECLGKEDVGQRGASVAQNEQQQEELTMAEVFPETGEALMMNKVLLKPEKEQVELSQRKYLFKTMCKFQGKCCKMVINNGSTDNLVSTEMVEKLSLKEDQASDSIQSILVT